MPISSNRSVICTAIWRDMLVSCSVSGSTIAIAPTSTTPAATDERDRARARDQQRVEHIEQGAEHGEQPLRAQEHVRVTLDASRT